MKFEFRVDAVGAAANLRDIAARGVNLGPPFAVIAKLLEGGLRTNVATRGAYLGGAWPGLAESTQERKSRQGLPSEEMIETGQLVSALEGGDGAVTRITPATIRVGVLGEFFRARFQMAEGRALVGVSPADEAAAVTIIHEWIERGAHV